VDELHSFVVADIPGLIEGAHTGAGLGHQFLRHIERTRLLVHLIDVSGLSGRDPWEDFETVNRELAAYSDRLRERSQLVALNKADMPDAEANIVALRSPLEAEGYPVFPISALTGEGVPALLYTISERLKELPIEAPPAETERVRFTGPEQDSWEVEEVEAEPGASGERGDHQHPLSPRTWLVRGKKVERLVAMTDMENDAGVRRMQRLLERMGVIGRLRDLGAADGDTVRIGTTEFDFID
jgi:GTP-binding protein